MTTTRTRTAGVLLATLAMLLTMVSVQPADATVGNEGCTPGYWKNHTDRWPSSHAAGDRLGDPFWFLESATWLANHDDNDVYAGFADDTLHEALDYGGGPGLDGATRILLRAATAALLNTASTEVAFITVNQPQIVLMVNQALQSNDRGTIIATAGWLDAANNGDDGCPLGGSPATQTSDD